MLLSRRVKGEIIEITLNNLATGHHPFHLHGHHFQVISHRPTNSGPFDPAEEDFPAVPMHRDAVEVYGLSSAVIRFRADNPGVWLFHYHVQWHVALGMAATIIEDPIELQAITLEIPGPHLEICKAHCIHTGGNAAGNKDNHFNLGGRFRLALCLVKGKTPPCHPPH